MAIRIAGAGAAELTTVPDPEPGDGEVVVDVATAAICSTDRKLVRRGDPVGRVLGHEGAGHLADGTPVGIHPDVGCGHCGACRREDTIHCPQRAAVGIERDGAFAEHVAVPELHVVPLDGVALDLAPMAEPLACCVHAEERLGARAAGPAVVVGAGAMGILMLWTLQAGGARVGVCQRSEPRRTQAGELGADAVFAPDDDPSDHLGEAPSAIVVTAPGAESLTWALENVRPGGVVHAFAGTPGGAPVDANTVHYRHLDLVGSTGSSLRHYRRALELLRSGAVDVDRLPRTRTNLPGAVDALTTAGEPGALRTIIELTRP